MNIDAINMHLINILFVFPIPKYVELDKSICYQLFLRS